MTTDWYSADTATFGDRLAAAREAADMTQSALARRVGVKLSTLRNWEQDMSEPRANRLSMLAGILNVSIMWLLSGQGDGVDAPAEDAALTPEVTQILTKIRTIRGDITQLADELGRLEKKLRQSLKDT
jgi:transcriptional regulator with XRE-family HTH domain